MRVLHIKPFFLPVDIQRNPYPCRFFNPKEISKSSVTTQLRRRYTAVPGTLLCSQQSKQMQCHAIVLDTAGTSHTHSTKKKRNIGTGAGYRPSLEKKKACKTPETGIPVTVYQYATIEQTDPHAFYIRETRRVVRGMWSDRGG